MAQRNRQQRNKSEYRGNREQYEREREQQARDDRNRYYEDNIGLRGLADYEPDWRGRSGQRSEQDFGHDRDYGRTQHFDESIAGRPSSYETDYSYRSGRSGTPFRGLSQRYQGSQSTFGTGGRFSNFGVGRNTRVGYSGYGAAATGPGFEFDRFDYDDRTSAGDFTGRGPKGYRRSDERIREEVCEVLTHDPYVDATEIEILVLDGDVTLSGNVDDRNQKRRAEDRVESVSGVRDVHNNVRVKSGLPATETKEQTGESRKESKRAA